MKQPDKKDYLSGDYSAFHSAGKATCRAAWDKYSLQLHKAKKRKLNYLWLANNQFTDLDNLLLTGQSFMIPDNNDTNRAEKRRSLVYRYGLPKKNNFIKIIKDIHLEEGSRFYDVVNLDTCSYLDKDTLSKIDQVVHWQLEEHCYFFATFARISMKIIMSKQFPEFKRLSGTKDGINDILVDTFRKHNYKVKALTGFPFTYETENTKKSNPMHSFGWELKRV